jgi:beta-lactamase regulating signal transducer with metallopeptidase domain
MIAIDPRWIAVTLAAWLLTYAAHSTVLLGAVGLLSRVKKLPANFEQTLWKTAILGSLITATIVALGLTGGSLGLRIHLAPTAPAPQAALHHPSLLPPGSGSADAELPVQRTWVVLALWAATGALGLYRLSRARQTLRDELGERRPLAVGTVWSILEDLRQKAGLNRQVRFTVSSQVGSPIAIGNHEICFPQRALRELKAEELRSALAHELAHLAHRDPAWKNFAAGVSAVFFFQPLLRLARQRLDETAEYLADDWAVRHSGNEISLARCLATVAGWQTRKLNAVAASGMAGGSSPLLKRVERLLGGRPSESARMWCYAGAALLVLGGWILAPGVTTRPRHADTSDALIRQTTLAPMARVSPESEESALVPDLSTPPELKIIVHHAPEAGAPHSLERMRRLERIHPRAPELAEHAPEERAFLPDRDTAPVARLIVVPHEVLAARLEMLRALPEMQSLDPEAVRALVAMQQRLFEMEMAARGIRVVWMAPPTPPTPPPAHSTSQI